MMLKNRWKKAACLILTIISTVCLGKVDVKAADYWPDAPETLSPSVILMEESTGTILYEKNSDEAHYPASITKIMTTLLALENGNLSDMVTFSDDAINNTEGSGIARDYGEQMTLEQCLYGVMLESANECAYAVAEHVGGTVENFVDMMNAKAKELSAYNFTVLIRQVPFDETEQFNTMEALLAEGVNGLVIAPFNSLYIAAEIDRLTEMNIPVITVNTDILSRRIAYVGSNYRLSGQTAAGLVSLMTFGEIHIGIVTGSSHVLCHSDRIEGFTSTLSEKGERIHIVETIENHDDDNESYEKVKEMLASHPEINVLYFAAGGVAGGCRAAVESGRIDAMRIFTYDCVPSTKKLLDDGIITATICQQPYKQGYLPVELLSRYLIEGISCEEFHYTDIDIRIKENL